MRLAAWVLCLVSGLVWGCELSPLTRRALYGGEADGGGSELADHTVMPPEADGPVDRASSAVDSAGVDATAADVGGAEAMPSPDAGKDPCAQIVCPAEQLCHRSIGRCFPRARLANLTGQVYSRCAPAVALDGVKVGYDGIRTCSAGGGKGGYVLRDVQTDQLMAVTAFKADYQRYEAPVTVQPGGGIHVIELVPLAGCGPDAGAAMACVCEEIGCNPS
jgi:hypothetical protein